MVKPTKMRNRQIYRASQALRSKQVSANLSSGLRSKYGRRSIRVVEGDTVMIKRGEYADVPGKVEKIDVESGRISVAGVKKEKAKGDKFDVMIHASNVLVTGLNLSDQRRRDKIGATGEYETDETAGGPGAGAAAAAATTDGAATTDDERLQAGTPEGVEAGAELPDGAEATTDEADEDRQADDVQDGDRAEDNDTDADGDTDGGAEDNEDGDAGGDHGESQSSDDGQADKTKQDRPGDEAQW
ncbi:MAG: 50S ribosomal protein L24 [Thaumarchaeota archaeon]|nr:50S ribosomal protein L24 [Nitrososphaerota archaeon]